MGNWETNVQLSRKYFKESDEKLIDIENVSLENKKVTTYKRAITCKRSALKKSNCKT